MWPLIAEHEQPVALHKQQDRQGRIFLRAQIEFRLLILTAGLWELNY